MIMVFPLLLRSLPSFFERKVHSYSLQFLIVKCSDGIMYSQVKVYSGKTQIVCYTLHPKTSIIIKEATHLASRVLWMPP